MAWASVSPGLTPYQNFLLEFVHDGGWLLFLSMLLSGGVSSGAGSGRNWLLRYGGVLLTGAILAVGTAMEAAGQAGWVRADAGGIVVFSSILTSLYALVGIEQIFRNARRSQRHGLKFICLGIGGIFAYDLFLYSNAVVDGQIRAAFWGARGYVVALCVPLIAISIKRVPSWSHGFFASRQIVFYTTTLFAAGLYLTAVGFAGYFIQSLGGEWADVLKLVFFSAAILGFFALVLSEQLRARIRVWLIKHFFERKYEYREEWLRLIQTLTGGDEGLPLKKRAIQALAQILESPAGRLWLRDRQGRFACMASWNLPRVEIAFGRDSNLMNFLDEREWVVDLEELANDPQRYGMLARQNLGEVFGDMRFIVPLVHESALIGFVALGSPRTPVTLNFEDHDLLKTAGRQIASYLKQEEGTELLAESRQFEAYNRFTAFIMHDLKNAIAQQSLVVENAAKHKRNPEFVDDAMETIKGSVERMRRVLAHMRQGAQELPAEKVDLGKIVLQAVSQCSDREPVPTITAPDRAVQVRANRDRMLLAVVHALRNAQDACKGQGAIHVLLAVEGSHCSVVIDDTGCGMSPEFVRDRLFRPFDSTKGSEGMGIGAYQVRETVRAAGGDIEVRSEVGKGTTLTMRMPVVGGGTP